MAVSISNGQEKNEDNGLTRANRPGYSQSSPFGKLRAGFAGPDATGRVLVRQCFVRGAVSPVVYRVADGGRGQVAAAHLVFGNAAQGFGYGLLGDGVRLFHGFA